MKKFLTLTTLLIAGSVLVACSNNKTNSSSASSSSSTSKTSLSSSSLTSSSTSSDNAEDSANAVLLQFKAGDFSSISGIWKNSDGDSYTISDNKFIDNQDNTSYSISVLTPDGQAGKGITFALKQISGESSKTGFGANPVVYWSGIKATNAIKSGVDTTDSSKIRIIISQSILSTSQDLAKAVYYRQ